MSSRHQNISIELGCILLWRLEFTEFKVKISKHQHLLLRMYARLGLGLVDFGCAMSQSNTVMQLVKNVCCKAVGPEQSIDIDPHFSDIFTFG